MHVQLIRNATLLVTVADKKWLVDPMLSEVGANPPVENTNNDRRNPLVPLPVPIEDLLSVDALLVTHTHRDHFDAAAAERLPKHLPLFCQPEDIEKFQAAGFTDIRPVHESSTWQDIRITRTGGQHGTGEIAKAMAPVSGYVLQAEGEPSLYIAGDTIWCEEVRDALDTFHPDVTVVNAGRAQFLIGDPIIMGDADIAEVCRHAPDTQVIAVHLDAINHCLQTRTDLRAALAERGLLSRVLIPEDGETIHTPE